MVPSMTPTNTDQQPTPRCDLCGKPIPDSYVKDAKCYGCGLNICEPCTNLELDSPMGVHTKADHLDARQ